MELANSSWFGDRGPPRLERVRDRLRLLEDEVEIVGMVLTYAWLCDSGRWDEIWSMYTDDFRRRIPTAPSEDVTGIDEVRARYQPLLDADASAAAAAEPIHYDVRGAVAPPVVRVSPDRASAGALATYDVAASPRTRDESGSEPRRVVTYLWTLRPDVDSGWRFAELLVPTDSQREVAPACRS